MAYLSSINPSVFIHWTALGDGDVKVVLIILNYALPPYPFLPKFPLKGSWDCMAKVETPFGLNETKIS